MADIQAVILAGGQGTRLRPYTTDTPKPLVEIGGRPIISILIAQLRKCGVTRLHLAVNHLADKIESFLGDGSDFGVSVSYHREPKPLSTAGPLRDIENLGESFLVVNGDVLTDIRFDTFFDFHNASSAVLTVATNVRQDLIDYGVIRADEDGEIVSFEEKPTVEHRVSMGVYAFSSPALDYIPADQPFGFDQLMLRLLESGEKIKSYDYPGYWMDIGRLEDYEKANREIDSITNLFPD
ncbi:MAG: sugar phosphate nucleotidyltransferase [bacterium]|nr:sugar phosphate nucleotidyltransferase [bacterium]